MLELQIDLNRGDFPTLTKGQLSRLARSVASRVRTEIIKNTPVGEKKKRKKGAKRAKDSWTAIRKDEGGYSFSNPTVQSWFLEHGSEAGSRPWPSTRERTVYHEGRIYSSQAPQGITTKANIEEFTKAIAAELFESLVKGESLAKR